MSESGSTISHHDRPRWYWGLLLLFTIIAMVSGVIGFHLYDATPRVAHAFRGEPWLRALYETIQLFLLHTPHLDKEVNGPLYCACYLAGIISLLTVLGVFGRIYATEFHHIRLSFRRNHVIICGAGWRGLALARDFSSRKGDGRADTVVVVEKDANAPGLRVCDHLGIIYLIADASNPRVLRTAGVGRARLIIATCTDDGLNLAIAHSARQVVEKVRPPGQPLTCYVQLSNPYLRTMARQKKLIAATGGCIALSTMGLDIYENGARALFASHRLDWSPIRRDSPLQVLLLIFGLGEMGESVLLQAARIGHFANGRPLRAIVVDREAAARQADLAIRYPKLGDICELEFHSRDANDPTVAAWADHVSRAANCVPTVVLTLPSDALNLALALDLSQFKNPKGREEPDYPIRVRMPSRFGMAELLDDPRQHEIFGDRIRPFGMLEDVCNRRALEESELDTLARGFHDDYVAQQRKKPIQDQDPRKLVPWEDLTEDIKGSNRAAADHIEIKLRAIGYRLVKTGDTADPVRAFSPEELELLARMEHERYCAQRWLAGWRYDPSESDPIAKTNPTLVPWDNLSEREREKDRDQVAAMPQVLDTIGLAISH